MYLTNDVHFATAANAFDRVADSYDELFTHTVVGRAQRKQVWKRLDAAFPEGSRILELNCGTGEDARFLSKRGCSVVACDGSAAMIEVAERNTQEEGNFENLIFRQMDNEDLASFPPGMVFDGAFSNFSGLNCLETLRPVANDLSNLVRPGGHVLICLWSRFCVAEMLWYVFHGQPKKAVRRWAGKGAANLGEMTISVSYPSVNEVRDAFDPWFQLTSRRAVGLFVPPSYVESTIAKRPNAIAWMESLDRRLANWPVLRDLGDHMLLEFVRCTP
ncbi:MAG TPA: class I SAM-dependent methyltransferase [Candidatus Acidoferrum sp.]|nr:class I SAM-dependent methyltransferase [Candidatus Acidoferrum sp.]